MDVWCEYVCGVRMRVSVGMYVVRVSAGVYVVRVCGMYFRCGYGYV